MKKKFNKLNKLNKMGTKLLISSFLIMVLGLVLIGTANFMLVGGDKENGFYVLQSEITSIAKILSRNPNSSYIIANFGSKPFLQLQFGVSFATIVTPILFASSIGVFCYSFYVSKKQKNNA